METLRVEERFIAFGDFGKFIATPDRISNLMALFSKWNMLPSTLTEFKQTFQPNQEILGKTILRPVLKSPSGFAIEFREERIDFLFGVDNSLIDFQKMEKKLEEIYDLVKAFDVSFSVNSNRIAFNLILSDANLTLDEIKKNHQNIFKPQTGLIKPYAYEWHATMAEQKDYSGRTFFEKLNFIYFVGFNQNPADQNQNLFSQLVDINTLPNIYEKRFTLAEINEFINISGKNCLDFIFSRLNEKN